MTNKKRQSKRKPKLPNKFNDHIMSNVSKNRNELNESDESGEIRVCDNATVEKIRENSDLMYKDGFDEGEKVKDACDEISDSVSEKIEDLNEVKNKGVFRWADKEYDIRNVIFRSMSKNDVEKETNADKQSNSNKLENVSSLNTSSSEVDAVNDCTIGNIVFGNSFVKSYAKTVEKKELNKNLYCIPTSKKDNGDEVVVFDEEIVEEGSKKWLSLWIFCWMQYESCPWMVNGKPLMVQNWNPDVCVEKAEPDKIPIWAKLYNIPLEAWSVKGLSALASRLGKPLVMDDMTASMCHNGTGISAFARILVEMDASKEFKDTIEIQYKDKSNNVIGTKFIESGFLMESVVSLFSLQGV
ncbi:RNA-directed DNA polymerase, eukaryota, reverse transcriptase zinc-binding domain protein [Tanacetum coccineum]